MTWPKRGKRAQVLITRLRHSQIKLYYYYFILDDNSIDLFMGLWFYRSLIKTSWSKISFWVFFISWENLVLSKTASHRLYIPFVFRVFFLSNNRVYRGSIRDHKNFMWSFQRVYLRAPDPETRQLLEQFLLMHVRIVSSLLLWGLKTSSNLLADYILTLPVHNSYNSGSYNSSSWLL